MGGRAGRAWPRPTLSSDGAASCFALPAGARAAAGGRPLEREALNELEQLRYALGAALAKPDLQLVRPILAFVAVAASLFAVGVAASALPAWRAVRVDPAVALRTE